MLDNSAIPAVSSVVNGGDEGGDHTCRQCRLRLDCLKGSAVDRDKCCTPCMTKLAATFPSKSWGEIKAMLGWDADDPPTALRGDG